MVPRVIQRLPEADFALLGNESLSTVIFAKNVTVRMVNAPIYSLREQWEVPSAVPAGSSLLWVPHYNIPFFSSVPLLVTVHDVLHVARPDLFPGWNKQFYAKNMFRTVLRRARSVMTVSRFSADELLRLFGKWAQPDRIHVVPNGVEESWFRVSATSNPHVRPYLLYVGNIKLHKNLRGLVAAFAAILGTIDVDLVIVGEQQGFITTDPEVFSTAAELGERVVFTGRMGLAELEQYYANAAALVLPSLYEGFGLTALEAMASGCPVAVSRVASMPEVCGDAAVYFDPENVEDMARGLRRVLMDETLRTGLRCSGRKRAALFSWDKAADRAVQIVRSILDDEDCNRP